MSVDYEFRDGAEHVDVTQLVALYKTTYWAGGRLPSDVARMLKHSSKAFSAWQGEKMVAFARVLTDFTYRATLWDVIVAPECRGMGLGKALMNFVITHPDLKNIPYWALSTKDRQRFYSEFEFKAEETWMGRGKIF